MRPARGGRRLAERFGRSFGHGLGLIATSLLLAAFFEQFGAGFAGNGNLSCSFTDTGLTTSRDQVACSAVATALWTCSGSPLAPFTLPVSVSTDPTVSAGQATGSMTLRPPRPSGQCPNGHLALVSVSYADVTLSGQAGDRASFFTVGPDGSSIVPSLFGPFSPG